MALTAAMLLVPANASAGSAPAHLNGTKAVAPKGQRGTPAAISVPRKHPST